MKPATYGPIYAAGLYPDLAEIFRSHGYALAVHGSVGRDFDLVAVPWIDEAADPQVVADDVRAKFAAGFARVDQPGQKPHGRVAYTLALSFGECALDISFVPRMDKMVRALRGIAARATACTCCRMLAEIAADTLAAGHDAKPAADPPLASHT